jgi:YD repeat-containing protein
MGKSWIKSLAWLMFFCFLWIAPVLAGTARYTYDSLNRLVQVAYDNGTTIVYTYDAAGNRTVQQVTAFSQ